MNTLTSSSAVDWNNLPFNVRMAMQQAGYTYDSTDGWTGRDFFQAYCEWEGLIGWSDNLWDTVLNLAKLGEQTGE